MPENLAVARPIVGKPPSTKIVEAAGSTAVDCVAVCCCFPLSVVKLAVLVALLPAVIFRRALMRRRRRRGHSCGCGGLERMKDASFSDGDDDLSIYQGALLARVSETSESAMLSSSPPSQSPEFLELENEMWAKFYGTGFWRSISQRE